MWGTATASFLCLRAPVAERRGFPLKQQLEPSSSVHNKYAAYKISFIINCTGVIHIDRVHTSAVSSRQQLRTRMTLQTIYVVRHGVRSVLLDPY